MPARLARTPAPPPLTVAVRRWPLATPTLRPAMRLEDVLWRPRRALPGWLRCYLLIELPAPLMSLPVVASPFRAGLAAVPSCLVVQGVLAALHHAATAPEAWSRAESGAPRYIYRKAGGSIVTSLLPPRDEQEPGGGAWGWDAVRALSDLDGDVLLALLASALDRAEDDGTTWISADAILDQRGIRPKTERAGAIRYRAGHRRADRERIAASMERLERIWVQLQDVALFAPRHGTARRVWLTEESALLLVTDRLLQDDLPVAWRYRPGPWLAPFLVRPNRQTALIALQILRYDPYRERWEKRLARYLSFHLRMDARRAAPLVRRIGPLLRELNLPIDRRHPERTRARFEGALARLARDGVIGAWTYSPAARDRIATLPARHWIAAWLALTVVVQPAAVVAAHYAAIGVPRASRT
jgi:hypothetical protein